MAGPATFRLWIAFGQKPLDDTALASDGNWVDVTDDCRYAQFRTSTRRAQFDTFDAGVASFHLDNRTRTYDPGYTSGTYYGQFLSNVPVRVTAEHSSTRYTVWRGTSRTWNPNYIAGVDAVTIVECEDLLGLISRYELSDLSTASYQGDTTADRIGRVLDAIGSGFPSAWRDLNNGGATCTHEATTWGVNALRHIVSIATADGGMVYCDIDGTIVHDSRNAPGVESRQLTSNQTFNHASEPSYMEAVWSGVGADYRDLVRISGSSGTVQEIDNTATDDAPVVFQKLNTSIESDSAAAAAAQFYADLYQTDRMFPRQVKIRIATQNSDLRTVYLQRRIRDRVRFTYNPPGATPNYNVQCFIDGISHVVNPQTGDWLATYTLSSADQYDGLDGPPSTWLVVGDATRGKVGTGTIGY